MINGSLDWVVSQILDADSHGVKEIGDDLGWLTSSKSLFRVVKSGWDHVRVDILSSTSADDFIHAVLSDAKLSSVEDHTNVRVWEVIFLIAWTSPRKLWQFAALHISEQESVACGGN